MKLYHCEIFSLFKLKILGPQSKLPHGDKVRLQATGLAKQDGDDFFLTERGYAHLDNLRDVHLPVQKWVPCEDD